MKAAIIYVRVSTSAQAGEDRVSLLSRRGN